MPSSSAVFRYLSKFHDEEEETKREPHRAFIPSATDALGGLRRVNSEMVGFCQRHARHTRATLDMDSTLVETHKQRVFYSYKKRKAYQPLSTYWAEADQIVHFVFENGVYEVTGGQKPRAPAQWTLPLWPGPPAIGRPTPLTTPASLSERPRASLRRMGRCWLI